MSRFLRTAAAAALAFAAAGAVSTAASAQSYNRIVVFGDSLSDNGNLYAVSFGTQPLSPPYYQGRFSNGPVFTELLGFNAGRFTAGAPVTGNVNYAFGGALAGLETRPGFPPGMRDQLNAYLGAGGAFGPNDLVSVLGGANNIFQRVPISAVSANPTGDMLPVVQAAAADINTIVDSVASRGAGTVLVTNLPRLGITPQFNQGPGAAAAPLADYAGQQFNSALLTNLTATAAARPGTNIILMDLYKISDTLRGNPGLFGLTNATDSCFNQTTMTICSSPNTYLYWDSVHPTAAGHQLIAALAEDYLYYGDIGAQSTVQGETGFRQREDLLDMASESLSGREAWAAGANVSFGVFADSAETDARGPVAEAEATGWGGRLAFDMTTSENWRFGLAASMRQTEVEAGAMAFDMQSFGTDFYLGWRKDNHFLNATVGGSIDTYDDITRLTSLAPIVHTGETSGASMGARVQGGVWFDMGGIAVSPRVAVNYVNTSVNSYIEGGVAAQYHYQDRTLRGASGEFTLRAEGGDEGLSFFVEGGYRQGFADDSDPVAVGIAMNPAQVLEREIEDPFGGSLLASAGVETHMGPVKVSFGYRGRFGEEADSHMGGLTLSLPLQ